MHDLHARHSHEENLEVTMQIAKSAALLAAAVGTVMLGAGSAVASVPSGEGGGDGGDGGTQINRCNSFSLIDLGGSDVGGSSADCLNFEETFGGQDGGGTQVNECNAFSVANLGNLLFLPIGGGGGSSVNCANVRR